MDPSTEPEDVAVPVRLVELADLKTKSGAPVRVYVERLPEEVLVDVMRQLPGEWPIPPGGKPGAPSADEKELRARKWLAWAPALIEAGSYMVRTDGTVVRPAFKWGEDGLGIRGSYLSARDRTAIMQGILDLSGWFEEANRASFHAGDGGGRGAGVGAVDPEPSGGEDPA